MAIFLPCSSVPSCAWPLHRISVQIKPHESHHAFFHGHDINSGVSSYFNHGRAVCEVGVKRIAALVSPKIGKKCGEIREKDSALATDAGQPKGFFTEVMVMSGLHGSDR
jgi:hypothetical protein